MNCEAKIDKKKSPVRYRGLNFTKEQREFLSNEYWKLKMMTRSASKERIKELAKFICNTEKRPEFQNCDDINVHISRVKIWFQNAKQREATVNKVIDDQKYERNATVKRCGSLSSSSLLSSDNTPIPTPSPQQTQSNGKFNYSEHEKFQSQLLSQNYQQQYQPYQRWQQQQQRQQQQHQSYQGWQQQQQRQQRYQEQRQQYFQYPGSDQLHQGWQQQQQQQRQQHQQRQQYPCPDHLQQGSQQQRGDQHFHTQQQQLYFQHQYSNHQEIDIYNISLSMNCIFNQSSQTGTSTHLLHEHPQSFSQNAIPNPLHYQNSSEQNQYQMHLMNNMVRKSNYQ